MSSIKMEEDIQDNKDAVYLDKKKIDFSFFVLSSVDGHRPVGGRLGPFDIVGEHGPNLVQNIRRLDSTAVLLERELGAPAGERAGAVAGHQKVGVVVDTLAFASLVIAPLSNHDPGKRGGNHAGE